MIMLNGFLRGMRVGALAMVAWAIVSGLTGWDWMPPLNIWVFAVAGLLATWAKFISDLRRGCRRRLSASAPGGAKCWR